MSKKQNDHAVQQQIKQLEKQEKKQNGKSRLKRVVALTICGLMLLSVLLLPITTMMTGR